MPRVKAIRVTMRIALMIHMVRMLEVMFGRNWTSGSAVGAVSGSGSQTMCGAGNSRVPLMKQTG